MSAGSRGGLGAPLGPGGTANLSASRSEIVMPRSGGRIRSRLGSCEEHKQVWR